MEKSQDAFRTISEVAEYLDIPQHVLRFWETRFNQIKPLKRGGGRRYYRPLDVDLIKGIKYMLYDRGYTIKGVQKLLKENGSQFIAAAGAGDSLGEKSNKKHKNISDDTLSSIPLSEDYLPSSSLKNIRKLDHQEKNEIKISSESRILLEQLLLNLLECKRLLDQERQKI